MGDTMKQYLNTGGNSNIESYDAGDSYIILKLKDEQRVFIYSYKKAGRKHVEAMKALAEKGSGLDEYINHYMKDLYE
jgi:mRNA-degrading endonuclease RelE of RelBE toxin-antitoxin system